MGNHTENGRNVVSSLEPFEMKTSVKRIAMMTQTNDLLVKTLYFGPPINKIIFFRFCEASVIDTRTQKVEDVWEKLASGVTGRFNTTSNTIVSAVKSSRSSFLFCDHEGKISVVSFHPHFERLKVFRVPSGYGKDDVFNRLVVLDSKRFICARYVFSFTDKEDSFPRKLDFEVNESPPYHNLNFVASKKYEDLLYYTVDKLGNPDLPPSDNYSNGFSLCSKNLNPKKKEKERQLLTTYHGTSTSEKASVFGLETYVNSKNEEIVIISSTVRQLCFINTKDRRSQAKMGIIYGFFEMPLYVEKSRFRAGILGEYYRKTPFVVKNRFLVIGKSSSSLDIFDLSQTNIFARRDKQLKRIESFEVPDDQEILNFEVLDGSSLKIFVSYSRSNSKEYNPKGAEVENREVCLLISVSGLPGYCDERSDDVSSSTVLGREEQGKDYFERIGYLKREVLLDDKNKERVVIEIVRSSRKKLILFSFLL